MHEENPVPWLVGLIFVFVALVAFDAALIAYQDSTYSASAETAPAAHGSVVATR